MAEIKQTGSLDLRSAKAAKDTAIENSDAINLTPWFSYGPLTIENTGKYWSSESNHYQVLDDGWGRFDKENTTSSDSYKDIAILPQDVFELGQEYTFLLEWRNTTATGSTVFYCGSDATHYQFIQNDENPGIRINSTTNSSGSDRRFITCTLSASDPNATRAIYWRARLNPNSSITGEFRLSVYKGRYYGGYKPYVDQSLINGYFNLNNEIDNVRSNATSFCPTSFDTKDPTKWYQVSWMVSDFTKLDDGWYHLETDNTAGSSAASRYIAPRNWDLIAPGETYTILFEIRNFSGPPNTATTSLGYIQEMAGAQFWGNSTIETIGRPNHTNKVTYFYANDISADGTLTFRMFKTADSAHLGDTQQYNGMCFRYRLYAPAGYVTSYDFRISIYPGKYYGGYTPYLINSTYYKILEVEDNAAPKATAIKRTQRIYYRSNSSTKPTTPGNATANWVTQTSNNVDATWTTAHLPISDTYKYIYTCEQSETNAGVVSYTTVLLDDTITVIDGGNIITGSVTSNAILAGSITSDRLAVYDATIQKIRADAIDTNSINIGYSQITNPPSIPSQSSVDDAAKTATNYISANNEGIKIANSTPASASSYQFQTATSTSFYVNNKKKSMINSNGFYIYDNSNNIVAEFDEDSVLLDSITGGSMVLDYHSLKLLDAADNAYFHVSDLRDKTGYATVQEQFTGDGEKTTFYLSWGAGTTDGYDVSVSDSSGGTVTKNLSYVSFSSPPNAGATITVNYKTTSSIKAFTFGNRTANSSIGAYSVCIGDGNTASGVRSFAEGSGTVASNTASHAEGNSTVSSGKGSHAEGSSTTASNYRSHAEGYYTVASGIDSHAEGRRTIASGECAHAEGCIDGNSGNTVASGFASHVEGSGTIASGECAHAEGSLTKASGDHAHAEAYQTTASGNHSHAEGWSAKAIGEASHAEGDQTNAIGTNSHAEGWRTRASGTNSHAEGSYCYTDDNNANESARVYGECAHAEGYYTEASGNYSHSEGTNTEANSEASHAEGSYTVAIGEASHAEGYQTTASGDYSHAEGRSTTASGEASHASGVGTKASAYQTVVGKYNTVDNTKLFIVGGGSSNSSTSNAFTVDASGIIDTKNGSIYATKLLASRSYSNSNPNPRWVLSVNIYDYSGLIIQCTDSQGSVKYTTLYGPFVQNTSYKFNVSITGVDPNVGLVFRSKTFYAYNNAIGTELADASNEYKYGRATLKNNGTFMWSYSDEIQVTKVYGLK